MINKGTQTPENDIPRILAELQRQVRELKGVQPIGSEGIVVEGGNLSNVNHTYAPGEVGYYYITFTPTNHILSQPDLAMSFYIDTDFNNSYLWPDGASLTSAQKKFSPEAAILDWAEGQDVLGIRVWKVKATNNDSVAHTVYAYFKTYSSKNPGNIA